MEFDRRHLAAHLRRDARVRQAPHQMPQNFQFRLCKFRAFCHADLNRRRRVRENMFPGHRLPDNIHQTLLRRVLIPQAVGPGPLCLIQNGAVPKEKITEGGGLSMLRRRIEKAGGKMEVWSIPRFKLIISLPEQEGAAHESDDR